MQVLVQQACQRTCQRGHGLTLAGFQVAGVADGQGSVLTGPQHILSILMLCCDWCPFKTRLKYPYLPVEIQSFLRWQLAVAKTRLPEREAFVWPWSFPLGQGPGLPAATVHGRARHMVVTAGEQGGPAEIMRPSESFSSFTKGSSPCKQCTIFKFRASINL